MHLSFLTKSLEELETHLENHFTLWSTLRPGCDMAVHVLTVRPSHYPIEDQVYNSITTVYQPKIGDRDISWKEGFKLVESDGVRTVTFTRPETRNSNTFAE